MKTFVKALAIVMLIAAPAHADFWCPGTTNGWDVNGNAMTETFGGSGIWDYSWTGTPNNRELFDIISLPGNWDSKVHPAGNQWAYGDGTGSNTLTLDTNTYADGWLPDTNRVKVAFEPNTSWTATGSFQSQVGGSDWDNGNINTPMADQGGGIFKFEATLAPGNYAWKPVVTGSWDSISTNSRNVNTNNIDFTTDAVNNHVEMWVDVLNGTVKTVITPEPATMALLGFGALALIRRRR
ncbi:MAG: PEP-CTERM sorting domain-containing protein [Phycisphaerales bacterium]|nr:PEP-CTERM sorting domain-containing protein [Phycisphaerales bacterium]MCB9855584.1 PEP-CTERM sorting domain-containing protein [Phycisphaerales bacterium]